MVKYNLKNQQEYQTYIRCCVNHVIFSNSAFSCSTLNAKQIQSAHIMGNHKRQSQCLACIALEKNAWHAA
jgi:hypothetical protein